MKSIWSALAILVAAVAAPAAAAPIEAYGGLPSIESVEISPDGSKLAVILTHGDQRTLGIKSLPDGATQTYVLGLAKVRRLDWVGDEDLIITASKTAAIVGVETAEKTTAVRREYLMGFQLNLNARKIQPLLQGVLSTGSYTGTHFHDDNANLGATLNVLAGEPEVRTVNGKPTLFLRGITFPHGWSSLTVFQMNLKTRKADLVEVGDRETEDIILDQNGQPVAKSQYDGDTGAWTLKLAQGGGWTVSRALVAKNGPPQLLGLGRDGRSVIVAESAETGVSVREASAAGWSEPLDVHDGDGLIYDPASHRLIGDYALVGDEDSHTFFDAADQAAWNAVKAAFKGQRVRLESWSQDRKRIVVLVDSPTEGPAYALVDVVAKRASWLGASYQDLTPEDIAPVQPVRFKAKDGLELTGYLTLPRGAPAKNLPLVVFPHGGPASRDTPGFDWWAQAMASRGYAVLQVNFRGSDGLSPSFLQAGFGQWGRKMQTDLSDGVRYLAGQGTVDPARVCIVGASYGGYAALAGAALDTGVYRCAVSVAGPADLNRFVSWSKTQNGTGALRYWTRFMGAENATDPALAAISPAAHADGVAIPVLLIHGRDDTVVPLEQSQLMADALKKAGKPVELLVQKGEDHWLSRGETRLQTLQATVAFLEKNNPPK